MADTVRDVLRAAQAAELGGDKGRAIELLLRAVELCRRAGNAVRAGQLLRYALRLDPSRADLQAELSRLEAASSGATPAGDDAPAHAVEEDADAGSLQRALREAELAVERRANPVALAVEAVRSAVGVPGRAEPRKEEPPPGLLVKEEGAFIERGPTRADPALDAWCSFCCRPRAEVGPLVAGPAGAFICTACIGESGALLGGVAPVAPPARAWREARRPVTLELLGQAEAQARLEQALGAGVRRVLVLGPEGGGKSTWARMLVEQGRGELVSPESLEQASVNAVLLVEDVDRLPPDAQLTLATFLKRQRSRTVVMTARGEPVEAGPVLVSDAGRLSVPTTAALAAGTRGALPTVLLEQVQVLVVLETLGVAVWSEIAQRLLAAGGERALSPEALTALATEAARSPRLGHELEALLSRVPPGTWRLEEAPPREPEPVRRSRRKKGES